MYETVFIQGAGNLGATLPSTSKSVPMSLSWIDGNGLEVDVRGRKVLIPAASVKLVEFSEEELSS